MALSSADAGHLNSCSACDRCVRINLCSGVNGVIIGYFANILERNHSISLISGVQLVSACKDTINASLCKPAMENIVIKSSLVENVDADVNKTLCLQSFRDFSGELFSNNHVLECLVHIISNVDCGSGNDKRVEIEKRSGYVTALGIDCLLLRYQKPTAASVVSTGPGVGLGSGDNLKTIISNVEKSAIAVSGSMEEIQPRTHRLKRIQSTQHLGLNISTGVMASGPSAAPLQSKSQSQLQLFLSSIVSQESIANSASELLELHSTESLSCISRAGDAGGIGHHRSKTGLLNDRSNSNLSSGSNSNSVDEKSQAVVGGYGGNFCAQMGGVGDADSLMYSPGATVSRVGSSSRLSTMSAPSASASGSHEQFSTNTPISGSQLGGASESRSVLFASYRDGGKVSHASGVNGDVAPSARPMSLFSTVITGGATLMSNNSSVGFLVSSSSSSSTVNHDSTATITNTNSSTIGSDIVTAPVTTPISVPAANERSCPLSSVLDRCFACPTCSPVHAGTQLAELMFAQSLALVEKDQQRHGGDATSAATVAVGSASKRTARIQSKLEQSHEVVSSRLKMQLNGSNDNGNNNDNGSVSGDVRLGIFSRKLSQLWSLCLGLSYHLQLLRLLCTKPLFSTLTTPAFKKKNSAVLKKSRQELLVSWRAAVKILKKSLVRYVNSRMEGVLSRLSIILSSYLSFSDNFSDNITFSGLSAGENNRGSVETVRDIHCLHFLLSATPPTSRSPCPGSEEVITSSVLVRNCVSMIQLLDYLDCVPCNCGTDKDGSLFSALQTHCSIVSVLAEHHPRFAPMVTEMGKQEDQKEEEEEELDDDEIISSHAARNAMGTATGTSNASGSVSEAAAPDSSVALLVDQSCSFAPEVDAGASTGVESSVRLATSAVLGLSYPKMMLPAPVPMPVSMTTKVTETSTLSPTNNVASINSSGAGSSTLPQKKVGVGAGKLTRTNALLSVQQKVDSRTGVKPLKLVTRREGITSNNTNTNTNTNTKNTSNGSSSNTDAKRSSDDAALSSSSDARHHQLRTSVVSVASRSLSMSAAAALTNTVSGSANTAITRPGFSSSGRSRSLINSITDLKRSAPVGSGPSDFSGTSANSGNGSSGVGKSLKRPRHGYGGSKNAVTGATMPALIGRSIFIPDTPETVQRGGNDDDSKAQDSSSIYSQDGPDATRRRLAFSMQ